MTSDSQNCKHGISGFCTSCLCETLGVNSLAQVPAAIAKLKAVRLPSEELAFRIARVLELRDPAMIGDYHELNMVNEPGATINVDDDLEFIKGRYRIYKSGRDGMPPIDFQSSAIFAVRDWLAKIFDVNIVTETPASWYNLEQERRSKRPPAH